MPIIGAFILPHPPLIVPEIGMGQEKRIQNTITAYEEVADRVARLKPDTIVIISPHSVMYSDYFHISPGEKASGSFAQFSAPQVMAEVQYDVELIEALSQAAGSAGIGAGTLGERDNKLDHGTLVPLYFISQKTKGYKVVRISISGLDVETHYRFGMCMREAAERLHRNVLIIASGDLSHRLTDDGPYGFSPKGPQFDREISQAMKTADFLRFLTFPEEMCEAAGECGLRSFIVMAGALDRLSVKPELLSYEGPFGVGYAVCAFAPGAVDEQRCFLEIYQKENQKQMELTKEEEDSYVKLARRSLERYIKTGQELARPEGLPEELAHRGAGVFVSLKKQGRLRGCIGTTRPTQSCVADEIIRNAVSAGTGDPRFPPVTAAELDALVYSVDVLGESEKVNSSAELDAKRYGVIVTKGRKRGLLLPNLEGVDTVEQQLSIALQKADISSNENYSIERFEVERHK